MKGDFGDIASEGIIQEHSCDSDHVIMSLASSVYKSFEDSSLESEP